MKLSITNSRNSSLSMMCCPPTFEAIDELMNQKLRGDDADQSHVVLRADGGALAKLVYELRHSRRIEDTVATYLLRGKQIVHVAARGGLEKTAGFWRPIGLLMTRHNRSRNESAGAAFQEVFFV